MLPSSQRLRSSTELKATVRSGVRSKRPTLVVHAWQPGSDGGVSAGGSNRVGFVVSKAVGGAVVRNRVKRQLRALARPLLATTPDTGWRFVIRALPAAAQDRGSLSVDLSSAWTAAFRKAGLS